VVAAEAAGAHRLLLDAERLGEAVHLEQGFAEHRQRAIRLQLSGLTLDARVARDVTLAPERSAASLLRTTRLSSATTSNDHSLIDWSIMRACCHSRRSDGFALLIALVRRTAPRHLGAHWHGAPDLLMPGLVVGKGVVLHRLVLFFFAAPSRAWDYVRGSFVH